MAVLEVGHHYQAVTKMLALVLDLTSFLIVRDSDGGEDAVNPQRWSDGSFLTLTQL
jgi:hypothetical protein